jgi:hypothetical protein
MGYLVRRVENAGHAIAAIAPRSRPMIPPTAAEFPVERAVVFVATAGSTIRARSTFCASESRPSASERSCWITLRRFSLIAIDELKFVISVSCSSAERLLSLTTLSSWVRVRSTCRSSVARSALSRAICWSSRRIFWSG